MQNAMLISSNHPNFNELCKARLRERSATAQVSEFAWTSWLEPLVFASHENSDYHEIELHCPTDFHIEYISVHFGPLLLKSVQDVHESIKSIKYVARKEAPILDGSKVQIEPPTPTPKQKTVIKDGLAWRSGTLNQYTFENFVGGNGNFAALQSAKAVAQAPGWTQYNPLVLFGSTGLGKTHLLHAIGNFAAQNQTAQKIYYRTTEQMLDECVQFMRKNKSTSFLRLYQDADILLIDDIQFLTRGPNTQDLFCQLFIQMIALQKQVVICSDRPPHEISDEKGRMLHERIIQSLQKGLSVDLSLPDSETRFEILKQKVKDQPHYSCLSEAVLEIVSQCHIHSVRELEGLLVKLFAVHDLQRKKVTPELVRVLLADTLRNTQGKISLDQILSAVALDFGMTSEQLMSQSRAHSVVFPRKVAMHLCRALTDNSLHTIGLKFNKDYTTVLFSIKTLMEAMTHDHELEMRVLRLQDQLKLAATVNG